MDKVFLGKIYMPIKVNIVRLILTQALVLMLAFSASASSEKIIAGPYDVSFNINTTQNYDVQPSMPIMESFRTSYPVLIKTNSTTWALIKIIEYKNYTDSTQDLWSTIDLRGLEKMGLKNITYQPNMLIDNKSAFGLTGLNSKKERLYFASYWLDSKGCDCGPVYIGKTNIGIESTYSLNETAELMSSLHVKKNELDGKQKPKPLTFAPIQK